MTNNGTSRLSVNTKTQFLEELRKQSNYMGCWAMQLVADTDSPDSVHDVVLRRMLSFARRPQIMAELFKLGWTNSVGNVVTKTDGTWPLQLSMRDFPQASTIAVLADRLYEKLPLQGEINEFLLNRMLPIIDSSTTSSNNAALTRGAYLPEKNATPYAFAHQLRTYMTTFCNVEPRVNDLNTVVYIYLDVMRVAVTKPSFDWLRIVLEFDPQYERTV